MRRWLFQLVCLLLLSGSVCSLAPTSALAQTISYSLRMPRGKLKYRAAFTRLIHKQLRSQLVQNSFGVSRGRVSRGFHINIRVSIEEELGADDPANCAISFDAEVIMMPQRRRVAQDVSSNGSGRYRRAAKLDRNRIKRLRTIAARSVTRFFAANLRNLFRQIQDKLKTLKPGQVLGKKVRRVTRGGGSGVRSGGKAAPQGRPLPGRPPLLKMIPAGTAHPKARPPFRKFK